MFLQNVSLHCRNFKCFADIHQGFEAFRPVNVIIGRNNSGKSTLLDLLHNATQPTPLLGQGHQGKSPQVYLTFPLEDTHLKELPDQSAEVRKDGQRWNFVPRYWSRGRMFGKAIRIEVMHDGLLFDSIVGIESSDPRDLAQAEWIGNFIYKKYTNPFAAYEFRRILADRDISPELSADSLAISDNGIGLTNVMQQYVNVSQYERDLIEVELLNELNVIFFPDAKYTRILFQQDPTKKHWELYLEESKKGRIPLSRTGSGLKTVLLVLANLLIVPKLRASGRKKQFIFGFEELENNLHPAIQRRLFQYLRDKSVKQEFHLFITTHSNVVIDLFSGDNHAQLLHVAHDGVSAVVRRVLTTPDGWGVLDDLDVRASDLLQTNALVWVEGPSDRIYFKRWIDLWSNGTLIEGIHYQCLFFGGSLNAHHSFDVENPSDLIAALKINHNAILLADRDRTNPDDELKVHTERLRKEVEIAGGYAWITEGKEIENYIPQNVYPVICDNPSAQGPGKFSNVFQYLKKQGGNGAVLHKIELAHLAARHLTYESVKMTLDMETRLNDVVDRIRRWNRIEADTPVVIPVVQG